MQNIQLYIEGNRVDMFKDESVSLTQTIQNIKDIAKVFTNFTKTFSLPASKDNNKIFKHYYNYDIVNGFDGRIKKSATIELNYLPFEDGKIKLEGVDLKNNKPYAYKVTFFGNAVELKDIFGDDTLQALNWLDNFKKPYSAASVLTGLTTGYDIVVDSVTYNKALLVPLISHTKRLFYDSTGNEVALNGNLYPHSGTGGIHFHGVYYADLKYALRVHLIIKAIEQQYSGIEFTTDFFNTSNSAYYGLYMWLHRKKGDVNDPNQVLEYEQYVNFGLDSTMTNVLSVEEEITVSGLTGANKITSSLTIRPNSSETSRYEVEVTRDGSTFATGSAENSDLQLDMDLPNGTYKVLLKVTEEFTFGETGVENAVSWDMSDLQVPESHTFNVTQFTVAAVFEFLPSKQIPTMKIVDFLTGLFKLFNLTAFVQDDGKIKVQTLDTFYSGGNNFDISEFVDVTSSNVNIALPYREIEFKYKGLGTKLALQHEQLSNAGLGWGTLKYNADAGENLDGGIYTVEAPFEHMKFERLHDGNTTTQKTIQVGWSVDDNDDPYIGEPLLFYPILQTNQDQIRFLNDEVSSLSDIDDYYIPSNSLALASGTSKINIHYNAELNEYTGDGLFTDTLFDDYYKTYISDVFSIKRRISKYKAFIPLKILRNYTLADRFIINNRKYKINSITTNLKTGESNVELLNEV
tara:strand:- start:8047 stop:10113 length:2067 start_codon:yes stop_codon:yes gene_type:complete